jgi:Fic family protein
MRTKYIHERRDWPKFRWDQHSLFTRLAEVRHRQGRLLGRMEALGFPLKNEAMLESLTVEVVKSSEIEGENLNSERVRSSIARRLGMDIGGAVAADRQTEGVVEMMLDATQNFAASLSAERLLGWHAAMFPTGRSGMHRIVVGAWRDDSKGPMQVVSGPIGHEKVHFEGPRAERLDEEMRRFIDWVNAKDGLDPVLRSALAHLRFVTIHPFDDGNGRIARAITDWALARSENSPQRFYSMSAQIRLQRNQYYEILERTQKGTLDITEWMQWFLACLDRAILGSEKTLADVFRKARLWEKTAGKHINERQRLMLTKLLDGFEGKLTSTTWAKIMKTSQDTAHRDIQALIEQGLLAKDPGGGRSTSYSLVV